MANRYTNLTPSAYTPLTLEEIAMVPAMRRKQHDAVLAQQELVRSNLAKVDPLSVHYNKALELKKGLEGKMDATAAELAANGINPDMIGKTLALNREVQDLISPMGDIGKINASKIEYNKQKEEFIKSAEANKIGRDRALKLWDEKTKSYTGFDTEGKISNVTPQGIAAYQDYSQDLSRYHSILGKTITGTTSSGHHLEQDGKGNFWEVTKNGERVKSDNTKQIEAAFKGMYDKWIAPGGEGTAYAKDAGLGIDQARIANDFAAMTETSDIAKSTESANYNEYDYTKDPNYKKPGSDAIPQGIFDPSSTKTLETGLTNASYDKIGTKDVGFSEALAGSREGMKFGHSKTNTKMGKFKTFRDVLDPYQQGQFEGAFNKLKKTGKIGANVDIMKLTPEQATLVGNHIKANIKEYTIGNDVIRADISPSNDQFMGQFANKEGKLRDELMSNEIDAGDRDVINPETGRIFTKQEWKDFKKGGGSIKYYGYDSPVNMRGYRFGNNLEQTVMAHKAILYDKDGVPTETAVSRTKQELEMPEFRASYNITHSYRNAINNPGKWKPTVDNHSGNGVNSTKGIEVKYDDGVFYLKKGNDVSKPLSPGQYMSYMYGIMFEGQENGK